MTRSATPGEPETEAGRRLLVELSENPLDGARYAHGVVALRLPAIEAEARAESSAEMGRLRAAAEAALTDWVWAYGSDFDGEGWPGMNALRAALGDSR